MALEILRPMQTELGAILALGIAFIFSQIFWAMVIWKLSALLMSKNFAEYKQAGMIGKKEKIIKVPLKEQEGQIDDIGILGGFNFG